MRFDPDWLWLILALMAAEAVALIAFRRRTGRGVPIAGLIANLAAGAALLGAVHAAATGGAVLVWLALALPAHLADVVLRWKT